MRLLVTGAAGLLGSRAARVALERGHDVHAATRDGAPLPGVAAVHPLERTSPEQAMEVLRAARPAWVIDCAAWTDVDGCERDPARADAINARGTEHLARAARDVGARVCYVSTDFVFGGELKGSYTEKDEPHPRSAYARSKLAGERAVLAEQDNAVVRSSVIYGWHARKRSFATWIVAELRAGKRVRIVRDQRATPTLADSLAGFLVRAVEQDVRGVYHAAGRDCCSRLDFAHAAARVFQLDERLIDAVSTAELRLPASRPANSCLDSSRAERELGYVPMGVQEGLENLRRGEPGTHDEPLRKSGL